MKQLIFKTIFFFIITASVTSCVQYEELVYFRKIDKEKSPRPQFPNDTIQNLVALRIQKNDVLSITINTFDMELSAPFNLVNSQLAANAQGGSVSPFISYIVDEKGQIDFPVLGKLTLQGLTISEAKDSIHQALLTYLKDPVVNMRLISFRVSVMGEVNKPGTFIINNDRITVLEALTMSGDLTAYSNRTNILVVREQDGIRKFGELNLQSAEIFKSEYYYLKQGDIVYIEPTEDKEAAIRDQFAEYVPWISTAIQAISTTITIIAVFRN
ncbi:MAG: polysaccharide export outer membrane protein [Saprospiraceae bacterium]|jgi:polysaccharide export outer membrane protein